ncbi:hypothetical protein ZIOFF_074442 (mitochondrion) [Zingiber officinale]|uniref:Uncharacterized protein n=1 Tax=Zingiber officinale TaxID=94328 RepID=A0A8J5CRA4_ZINOF|nr:hypothetical protein ZIOFF_074442 [Zingiber officinale]
MLPLTPSYPALLAFPAYAAASYAAVDTFHSSFAFHILSMNMPGKELNSDERGYSPDRVSPPKVKRKTFSRLKVPKVVLHLIKLNKAKTATEETAAGGAATDEATEARDDALALTLTTPAAEARAASAVLPIAAPGSSDVPFRSETTVPVRTKGRKKLQPLDLVIIAGAQRLVERHCASKRDLSPALEGGLIASLSPALEGGLIASLSPALEGGLLLSPVQSNMRSLGRQVPSNMRSLGLKAQFHSREKNRIEENSILVGSSIHGNHDHFLPRGFEFSTLANKSGDDFLEEKAAQCPFSLTGSVFALSPIAFSCVGSCSFSGGKEFMAIRKQQYLKCVFGLAKDKKTVHGYAPITPDRSAFGFAPVEISGVKVHSIRVKRAVLSRYIAAKCSVALQQYYAASILKDSNPSVMVELSRAGLPTIIPVHHRHLISQRNDRTVFDSIVEEPKKGHSITLVNDLIETAFNQLWKMYMPWSDNSGCLWYQGSLTPFDFEANSAKLVLVYRFLVRYLLRELVLVYRFLVRYLLRELVYRELVYRELVKGLCSL